MRQPVAGANRLLSAFAPASVIANEGPGTLYLYRNSAVSAAAYDAVVGPGGTVTWPGGEVWGFSSSTVLNILNVGAGIDSGSVTVSGTVAVQGTVATSGGGTGGGTTPTPPSYQGASSGRTTGNALTLPSPANTTSASLLVGLFESVDAGTNLTGWTGWKFALMPGSANVYITILTKVGSSADANGAGSYTFTGDGGTASGIVGWLHAFNGVATLADRTETIIGSAAQTTAVQQTPSCNTSSALLAWAINSNRSITSDWAWSTTANGGPPAQQPAWTAPTPPSSNIFAQRCSVVIPNWSEAAYNATISINNNTSAYSLVNIIELGSA